MKIKDLVYIALFTSMMIVLTCVITIPIGIYGYINLSDLLIMLLSSVYGFGPLVIIGGVGCALSDLFLGYSSYALFSFFIKSIESIIVVFFVKRFRPRFRFIAYLIGGLWMLVGYALSDAILGASFALMVPSFIANLPQALICVSAAALINIPFERFVGTKINETK